MKQEYHEDDRFEADQSQRKVKDRTGEQRKPAYRAELVYAADISSVLDMFARQLREDEHAMGTSHGIKHYDFYFACLDRIDILLTEKNSQV